MKTKLIIIAAALITLASCQQDETADGNQFRYPLQIGSVTVADANTRVSESTDGSKSSFANGDQISVQIGTSGNVGTYTYDGSTFAAATDADACYWQSTATQDVTAWYPASETVSLSNQSKALAYVLQAEAKDVAFNSTPKLTFSHQLAKLRVKLTGVTEIVTSVSVKSYTSCINDKGTVSKAANASAGYISMKKNGDYWEANVVPGYTIEYVKINSTESKLSTPVTPDAGKLYTVTVTVNKEVSVNLNYHSSYTIYDSGTYTFKNNGYTINIQSGSPTIILNGVTLTSNIASTSSGTVTIVLNNNTTNTISGLGIEASGNINIKGGGSLEATGSSNGIYSNYGSITISDGATVTATGGSNGIFSQYGSITISDGATVTATGSNYNGISSYYGNVTITGSTVTATGNQFAIMCSKTITIKSSTVTKNGTTTKYDASGNPQSE